MTLASLPRKPAFDFMRANRRPAPLLGHEFSSIPIVPGSRAVLHEEDLEGQPPPEGDTSEATPLDTAPVAAPMSDTDTGGGTKTGETGCDTATGKIVGGTLNPNECTKDCSTKHEDKHAADIAPCCTKAGEAAKAAKSDADRAAVQTTFENWMLSNKPLLECRAYAVSVSCGDAKHKKLNCEKQSYGKCCKSLVWYIRSATLKGQENCAQAGKALSDCPFK